jgi:TolB-like protein
MKRTPVILVCLLCGLCLAQAKKTTIAVMSFKGSSGITQDESDLLTDRLRVELFNTGKVEVMEREQMQAILKEQGFQKSGACTDEGCMVEMGEILGVQKLITGSIGKIGSLYLVNARVIDIKTAKISRSVSEDVKGSLENVVERLPDIAARLCSTEPRATENRVTDRGESGGEKSVDTAQEKTEQPEQNFDCKGAIFVERTEFSKSSLGFYMTNSEWRTAYDKLVDVLKSCFKTDLRSAGTAQLASAGCSAPVIRCFLNSYTTRPTKFGQREGTLNLTLAIYDSYQAKDALCVFRKEATGENHWGDKTPFSNAIEAVAGAMKSEIGKSDCVATLNRKSK